MTLDKKRRLVSLIVPCYYDEEIIGITHDSIIKTLGTGQDFDLEIVYIDDGSKDNTSGVLAAMAEKDDRITFVKLSRNFGQQAAISAGFQYAKGDGVAVMDSDLQDPPEVLLDMIKKWQGGYDIVYGIRTKRKESGIKKFCYSAFYYIMRKMADIDIPPDSGDFSIIDRKVVDVINALPERNRFIRGLRAWCGFNHHGHVYEREARVGGTSYYSLGKAIKLALDGFFNFSVRPLSFITFMGILAASLSFVLMIFFLIQRLIGFELFGYTAADVPGFTSIILCILFFSGVQLISVGILGEYIGRIYEEVKKRPVFIAQSDKPSRY